MVISPYIFLNFVFFNHLSAISGKTNLTSPLGWFF